jgi:Cu(I)/Ag(I) efflux system outer membrane protein
LPDERLKALTEIALKENRDLRLSFLKIRETLAQYGVVSSERLPWLNFEASHEVSGGGGGVRTQRQYETGLVLPAFELDFFRRAADMSLAARETYLASQEAFRYARLALISSVAGAYLDSRLAFEKLRLTERTLASWRSSKAFIEQRIISGQSTLLDLERAKAMAAFAEAELEASREEIIRAENGLKLLLGDFIEKELPAPSSLMNWKEVDLPSGLSSESLLSRPDILEAEHKLKGAHADIGAARAAFFPKISLTAALGLMSMDLASLFNSSSSRWSYGPQLSLPIFSGGRNRANLEQSLILKEAAVAQYELVVQRAFKEAAEGLEVRRILKAREAAQKKYFSAQTKVLELATSRYQSGAVSYLEVLDAQREVFEAEKALLELKRNQAVNDISLYVTLGGGFPEPPKEAAIETVNLLEERK